MSGLSPLLVGGWLPQTTDLSTAWVVQKPDPLTIHSLKVPQTGKTPGAIQGPGPVP